MWFTSFMLHSFVIDLCFLVLGLVDYVVFAFFLLDNLIDGELFLG